MNYSLFGSTGNLIDWFEDESVARSALQMIVDREPESADDVALFVCDDDGEIIEGPIHGSHIGCLRRAGLGPRAPRPRCRPASDPGVDVLGPVANLARPDPHGWDLAPPAHRPNPRPRHSEQLRDLHSCQQPSTHANPVR